MTSAPRLRNSVPSSVLLATWANAWAAGHASLDDAVTGARADGPPHLVADSAGRSEALIVSFRGIFEGQLALAALPVPGFLLGLAGPDSFNRAALGAGGAVLSGDTGLVPQEVSSTDSSSGGAVLWQRHTINPTQHHETLRGANFHMRESLTEAAEAFGASDLRPAREELLDALVDADRPFDLGLPRTFDEADERIVRTALQCLHLTTASREDHAADLSSSAAALRSSVLGSLDRAARRVLVAASAHRPRR